LTTREELDKAQVKQMPLDDLLEQYRTKMVVMPISVENSVHLISLGMQGMCPI
jgi:hypothetical protein